jgi:hypothetical protein
MKRLQLITMIACLAFVVGCESTDTTGTGNQERKRLAAVQQQAQQAQPDESEQNLWNAQQDILNRDGNPARQP